MLNSIKSKLVLITGGFVLLTLVIVVVTFWTVNQQRNYALLINLAGRQRMLTQKYTKEVFNDIIPAQIRAYSLKAAEIATVQIKEDRIKYAEIIAERGGRDHLPLPATFVQEVSAKINRQGLYRYALLSRWNINKNKGLETGFEKAAFDYLLENKQNSYYRFLQYDDKFVLRYATSDVASSVGCVRCHNALVRSAKRNFKQGDVMGMLVVTIPITDEVEIGEALFPATSDGDEVIKPSEATKKVFEMTLDALMTGGQAPTNLAMTEFSQLSPAPKKILHQLEKVKALWQEMQVMSKNIESFSVNSPKYLSEFMALQELNLKVNSEMDKAVGMYEAVSKKKGGTLMIIQVFAFVFVIVMAGLGWYMENRLIVGPVEKLEELTYIDDLTGIANRRSYNKAVVSEWNRAMRWETSLSLIMVDIDYFKLYNDSMGHVAGDECLRNIAQALKSRIVRAGDLIARYGGEEFVVILPNTDLAAAGRLAELMRKKVESLEIKHPDSKVSGSVTISLGVASMVPDKEDISDELVSAADNELYKAKEGGRNCVKIC